MVMRASFMKKYARLIGLAGLLLFLPMVLWVGVARAQSFKTGDNITVGAKETVDSSLYTAGRNIDIAGQVNGDVFCAGQSVTISGKVDGDVICAGQTVNISGTVTGDVRIAGQSVTMAADVQGNLSAAAQSFSLTSGAKVGRDATVGGSDVTLNGNIGRDLIAGGANVIMSSAVGRNVTSNAENLKIQRRGSIGGNLTYTSANQASIDSQAQIKGASSWNKVQPKQHKTSYSRVFAFQFGFGIVAIISLLAVSLALVLIFPGLFRQTSTRAMAAPFKTLLTGILAGLAAPVVILALMMTLIGIPLGLLVMLAWMLVLFLSGPFFGYMLGSLILRNQTNAVLVMIVGSLVVLVAYLIPILGLFMLIAVVWMGTGMILREIYHRVPKPIYDVSKKSQ